MMEEEEEEDRCAADSPWKNLPQVDSQQPALQSLLFSLAHIHKIKLNIFPVWIPRCQK